MCSRSVTKTGLFKIVGLYMVNIFQMFGITLVPNDGSILIRAFTGFDGWGYSVWHEFEHPDKLHFTVNGNLIQ